MVSAASLVLCASLQVAAARLLHSLPEDPHAFPKFRVSFMNGQPIGRDTAERWLREGLRGGELEFADQPWHEDSAGWRDWISRKEIGGSESDEASSELLHPEANHTLELMRMGPESYLCYVPKPLDYEPPNADDAADAELTPARSWQLLQPLTGTCLYHRQGWFTYSYCHGQQIRQFKELIPSTPHAATGYRPAEDPEWDSYTLGRAPRTPEPGADLTVAEQNALAANIELAKNAGSRYLVQRWGDGTICDKTGKPREVEVQFHCSMAMTDTILFVKEAKTCSYVLVIHTPRLCGEPGFKSRRDAREEAVIRCREVVAGPEPSAADLPQGDHPYKHPRRKTSLPATRAKDAPPDPVKQKKAAAESAYSEILRRALNAFLGAGAGNEAAVIVEDGDVVIEVLDEGVFQDMDDAESNAVINEALRAAGFAIKGNKFVQAEGKEEAEGDEENYDDPARDEL